MIEPAQLAHLSPAKRAEIIYAQARSEVNAKLWQMALGSTDEDRGSFANGAFGSVGQGVNLNSLLALLTSKPAEAEPAIEIEQPVVAPLPDAAPVKSTAAPSAASVASTDLGRNARFQPVIEGAARRAGIPAPALAAIIDAEAGKLKGGEWNPFSRNPRSSAAGLGQFLTSTWISEAQKTGNWLNSVARQNGWLDGHGKVLPDARHQVLALRYDPRASIEATADYARNNLKYLERAGVRIGESAAAVGRVAYIAHHLGVGDTVRFMRNGIPEERARTLLSAQIGSAKAAERIDQAGSAKLAHREWLNGFVARQVRPHRFASEA
jgi:hypothetical protein